MRLNHPEPVRAGPPVFPVFIPFAGCAGRCVFCSQERQTGTETRPLDSLRRDLEAHPPAMRPVPELAFYGGTFTALPLKEQEAFLTLAAKLKAAGSICRTRCSTRPDALKPPLLARLAALGLDCLELGIQSFSAAPLQASRRGYSPETALRACRLAQEAGLELGVQLMPGMPGMEPEHFQRDMELCLELRPSLLRLYPCLVLEGTALAQDWKNGAYTPWSLELIMELLPPAILRLWRRGIRVIRLGLAPEEGLEPCILAGPRHPALGQRLRSRALFLHMKEKLPPPQHMSTLELHAPNRCQGEFFGHRGELKEAYARLGLTPDRVRWREQDYFELVPRC
ncbi:MAG: radical SAM protein [Deltaproteobacteria bacterium]|jgi:histone acetyltransferase (RNA polymerase elongator complex component)|nr:radical SAM protein [Deltaproteobacteria bacterium]